MGHLKELHNRNSQKGKNVFLPVRTFQLPINLWHFDYIPYLG
jgi:hypothetical protein